MAAMVWAAATWVVIPNVDKDSNVQSLGAYAVAKQNNPYLKFIKVVRAEVLDRGTQHYTYRLAIQLVEGSQKKYYWSEILQDLGAPNQPPVLNIASFKPISGPASTPNWVTIPDVQKNLHVRSIITYAVERFNAQTQASFEFIDVLDGQLLDRGAKHYTYHLTIRVHDRYGVKKYKIEVFEDLNTPGQPPVLNLGHFILRSASLISVHFKMEDRIIPLQMKEFPFKKMLLVNAHVRKRNPNHQNGRMVLENSPGSAGQKANTLR
ncbi:hypothetical protein EJ110_NYTH25796 [Nymphaea thermarum]|nr:hypothetical protein EJ110_NYTH25796 [Nymphaea thermarum]